VGKGNSTEGRAVIIADSRICGELVAAPEHDRHATRLEEGRLLHLLPSPAKILVETKRPGEVPHAERDDADSLLHAQDGMPSFADRPDTVIAPR